MFSPLLHHASLWAGFCMTPVLLAGCDVLVECLTHSHGRVQSGCCTVVFTPSLPDTGVHKECLLVCKCECKCK